MYKESVCAETESKKVNAMRGNRWAMKYINICCGKARWENMVRRQPSVIYGVKLHTAHPGKETQLLPQLCTLQVFKFTYVVLQKLYLGKFNAIIFQFRTTKTINENEGN